jgi:hypothetical protein
VNEHQGEPHENSNLIIWARICPSAAKIGVDIILYVPILTLAVECPEHGAPHLVKCLVQTIGINGLGYEFWPHI